MAEFAIAAQDLGTGYKQGDLISVMPDGTVWGTFDTLPNIWIVKVPSVSLGIARQAVRPLDDPAMPGDPELLSPDPEDRRIRRHRSQVRVFVDDLPLPKRTELDTVGITTLTLGQAQAATRKMVWNRGTGEVDDTGIGEFG